MRSNGFGMNCKEFRYIMHQKRVSVGRISVSDAVVKDLVKPYFIRNCMYSKRDVSLHCTCKLNYNIENIRTVGLRWDGLIEFQQILYRYETEET